ncbi:MAG: hypothetical protein ACFFD4_28600 [Candidatus Odinarchaeota archaeon]
MSFIKPKVFTMGFPLKYASHPRDFPIILELSEKIIDAQEASKALLDPLSVLFLQGTKLLVSGDISLETGKQLDAVKFFEKAEDQFLQMKSSSDFAKPTSWPDLQYEVQRRILYIKGRISHAYSALARKNKEIEEYVKHLVQASRDYSDEMIFERNELDYYNLIVSLRNLHLVYIDLADYKARKGKDIREKQASLYTMKTSARKAIFLGADIEKEFFERIERRLVQLMTTRFTEQAEGLFNKGVQRAADEKHRESGILFLRGEKIYSGLRRIVDSPDFRLQEQIFKLHKIESIAKDHLIKDENDRATRHFQEAITVIQQIVNTVKEFGQPALVQHFQLHSTYFDAMGTFCEALGLYDAEQYENAKKLLENVKKSVKQVEKDAKDVSPPLVQSCKSARNLVDSYLETLNLLLEE